jgi:hypothetical protein
VEAHRVNPDDVVSLLGGLGLIVLLGSLCYLAAHKQ